MVCVMCAVIPEYAEQKGAAEEAASGQDDQWIGRNRSFQQLAATGSSGKRTIWIINRMTSADTKSFFINMPPPYEKI